MAAHAFAKTHRWDGGFTLLFLLVSYAAILVGFSESVWRRFEGRADFPAPPILQLHVFLFTAWMLGLAVQFALARGHIRLHRLSGLAMLALVPAMAATAIGSEVISQRHYAAEFPDNIRFFIEPIVQVSVFVVCVVAGFAVRRDPPAHKRLMLLATTAIMVAPFSRMWGDWMLARFGDGYWGMILQYFTGPDLMMAALITYDLSTRGSVHHVYRVGVPLILASQLAASAIYHSDTWPLVARGWIGI